MILARDERPRGFGASQKAEHAYARQLRKLARHIADIVNGFAPDGEVTQEIDWDITQALQRYAEAIEPWAETVAQRMLGDVNRRDEQTWFEQSKRIGRALRDEIDNTPVGNLMRERLAEQVTLIKSLPLDAAQRVHEITLQGITEGRRPKELADLIFASGDVSRSRATLIARTETARTASLLTQARAESVGCTHFVWLTSRDANVRESHRAMQGVVCEYKSPPIVEGKPTMPGQVYNCRCTQKPIYPE